MSLAIEERGDFDPPVVLSEIDSLREDAVGLAAESLVVAARGALSRDDTSEVRRILTVLEELVDTGPWAANAQLDIISPALERFRELCRSVRGQSGSKIVREQNAGDRNKALCDTALKRFRAEVQPGLENLIRLLPSNHEGAQQAREEAAACLSGIATDYTWADDFIASENLHEEALKLAPDTLGAIRIEDGLAQVRGAAHNQRVFGTPISSAPSLRTVNGFGFALYGSSDYDEATRSYSTTHYFVGFFVPIFPVSRYRVINTGPSGYRFLGKIPFRRLDRWHLGISLTAIAALIIIIAASSSNSSNVYSNTPTSSYPSAAQDSGTSIAETPELTGGYSGVVHNLTAGVSADFTVVLTERNRAIQGCMEVKSPLVGSGSLRGTASGSELSFVVVGDSMQIEFAGRRSAGNLTGTYVVSRNGAGSKENGTFFLKKTSSEGLSSGFNISSCPGDTLHISTPPGLAALKSRIDSGRLQMAALKTQIQPVIDELTSLNAQMQALNAELKSLDEQHNLGSQIDTDDYNAKVNAHNALLARQRALIAANRADLKTYDDLIDQDSALVKQYNALLK